MRGMLSTSPEVIRAKTFLPSVAGNFRLKPWGQPTETDLVPMPLDGSLDQLETIEAGIPLPPYQRSTAEQDHEDDETLKPAVLHDAVAGLAQSPPDLPWGLGCVYHAAGTASDAACEGRATGL